jgi:hypothetical protein
MAPAAWADVRSAVAYLEQEVPRWRRENKCYSCHNNGDGARALFAAMAAGVAVRREAVDDTLAGLAREGEWEAKPLAWVQYGAAMAVAARAKLFTDSAAVERVAALVAKAQSADGHWQVEEEKSPGAPATYGPDIGTALAISIMDWTGRSAEAARGRQWLAGRDPSSVLTAAGVLMGGVRSPAAEATLVRLQHQDGSWQHEPFDTAVAILGLARVSPRADAIQRGRAWLIQSQSESGGWAATTRPAGGDSYAQHISTTAWSILALLPMRE